MKLNDLEVEEPLHKDCFNTPIIASAMYHKLDIITVDAQFSKYSDLINVIW